MLNQKITSIHLNQPGREMSINPKSQIDQPREERLSRISASAGDVPETNTIHMKSKVFFSLFICLSFLSLKAQLHKDTLNSQTISQKNGGGTAAWVDYDGDGDLDLVVSSLGYLTLELYLNEGGVFTYSSMGVLGTNGGSIDFADYDGDGDQDLLVTRSRSLGADDFFMRLYENTGEGFSSVNLSVGLPFAVSHDGKWGDYDGDGDPDIAVIAENDLGDMAGFIYRNDEGEFTDIGANLPISQEGSLDWADYGNDGDLDLLITGFNTNTYTAHSTIFENNGGVFEDLSAGLAGVMYSTGRWGDYDQDGDLDVVVTGSTIRLDMHPFGDAKTVIYRNDDGTFTDIGAGVDDLLFSHADWGDMENDGDLDLILTGLPSFQDVTPVSKVYQYAGGEFTDMEAELPGAVYGEGLWADYNGDDTLDIVLIGQESIGGHTSQIRNLYTRLVSGQEEPEEPEEPAGVFVKDEVASALFVGAYLSNAAWADYDGDLDMDLLLTGLTLDDTIANIYENDGGTFTKVNTSLPGIFYGGGAFGMFTDQRRDVLLAGLHEDQSLMEIYAFDGINYSPIEAGFRQLGVNGSGNASWGDIDGDGDLDVIISGYSELPDDHLQAETRLYENTGDGFMEITAEIEAIADGEMVWGDYDGDGDLDLVISGDGEHKIVHKVYTNTGGTLVENPSELPELVANSEVWGDYDGDGDLDLLFSGQDAESNYHTLIYKNVDGAFLPVETGLTGSAYGSVDWGDYDGDGDLDVLVTGEDEYFELSTTVYRNDGETFSEIPTDLPGVFFGTAKWVKADDDKGLDIFITGWGQVDLISELWKNTLFNNEAPSALNLNNRSVLQSGGSGVAVGELSATDPDGDELDFSLIEGPQENQNSYFHIADNILYADSTYHMPAGDYSVYVKVEDNNGGVRTQEFIVEVLDDFPPVPKARDISLYLDEDGTASLQPEQVDNGSYDPTGGEYAHSVSQLAFSCSDLGVNQINYTVKDANDNDSTVAVSVTVLDTLSPEAKAKDLTLYLDETGNAALDASELDAGSSDNCSFTTSVSKSAFDCSDLGPNIVTFTVTDADGNTAELSQVVTVADTLSPEVQGKDLTLYLDETGNAALDASELDAGSSDNCSFTTSVSKSAFDCSDLGPNIVTFTVTDADGNAAELSQVVIVADTLSPEIQGKDLTLYLDETGNAALDPSELDAGSSDNCSFTTSVSKSAFDCSDLGPNIVTFTVTDADGNTAELSQVVTVADTLSPEVQAKDLTLYLDETGNAALDASELDAGSSDNCSFTTSVSKSEFDCSDLGQNIVTFTVTDADGNTTELSQVVTVADTLSPEVQAKDLTLYLDETGNATLDASELDAGSSDNCSFTTSVSKSEFDCSDLGQNIVTFTVTDADGNTTELSQVVTVADTLSPEVQAKDLTLYLDETGNATLDASELDAGSSDNCSFTTSVSKSEFDCSDLGQNIVTFTVTDADGNTAELSQVVTVADTLSPEVQGKDLTLYLDETGNATLDASELDAGSSDNCSFTTSVSKSAFDCSDLGPNTVEYVVTDESGNASSVEARVTVVDTLSPHLEVHDITLDLNEEGLATIDPANVNGASSDNCSVTLELSQDIFTCEDLGSNFITITATDASGNTSATTVTVTVQGVCEELNVLSAEMGQQLTIYPNPASTKLSIRGGKPFAKRSNLEVIDLSGKVMLTTKATEGGDEIMIDIGHLKDGLYIVLIKDDTGLLKLPFVKK